MWLLIHAPDYHLVVCTSIARKIDEPVYQLNEMQIDQAAGIGPSNRA